MDRRFLAVAAALMNYEATQGYLGGVSRSTVKGLVADNELRKLKIGRRTLFRRDDLDAYIERRTPGGDVA
ncbi:MAG: helix-turn-helix domain-containing protein [Candidatus Cybelea sp.]